MRREVAAATGTSRLFPGLAWELLATLLFGLWLLLAVDLRLVPCARDKLFLLGFDFFSRFALPPAPPGGFLEWLDRLFLLGCHTGWPAAAALSALFLACLASVRALVHAAGGPISPAAWAPPALALVASSSAYEGGTALVLGSALAYTMAWLWSRLPLRAPPLRVLLFTALFALTQLLAGPPAWSFAALAVAFEFAKPGCRRSAVALLVAGGILGGLAPLLALLPPTALPYPGPAAPAYADWLCNWRGLTLLAYLPLLVVALTVWPRIGALLSRVLAGGWRSAAGFTAWVAAAALIGLLVLDRGQRLELRFERSADRRDWADVLRLAPLLNGARYTPHVNLAVNQALYHIGRLGADLFAWPQPYATPSLQESQGQVEDLYRPCEFFIELGRLGEALHLAHEQLELAPTGRALKNLAFIQIVRGELDAARPVLQVLRREPRWGGWAAAYLRLLDDAGALDGREEIHRARAFMLLEEDTPRTQQLYGQSGIQLFWPAMLISLLKRNPQNRQAFEWLVTFSLLNRDLSGLVTVMRHLAYLPYPSIPPLWEQGLMAHALQTGAPATQTPAGIQVLGFALSQGTVATTRRFFELVGPRGPSEEQRRQLERELSGTYYFYLWYGPGASP